MKHQILERWPDVLAGQSAAVCLPGRAGDQIGCRGRRAPTLGQMADESRER